MSSAADGAGRAHAYNPTTNSWRTIAALPTAGGTCQSANGFVLDGELWIVGCLTLPLAQQVWIYNPGADSWRAGAAVQRRSPGTRQRAVQRSRLRRWRWQRRRWLDGGRVGRAGRPATTASTTSATSTASATTASASAGAWATALTIPDSGNGIALPLERHLRRAAAGRSPRQPLDSTASRTRRAPTRAHHARPTRRRRRTQP